jgi:hypothetical protein
VPGLNFDAYAIERYECVAKDGQDLMRALALTASSTGSVKHARCLARIHREISVSLCKGNHAVLRAALLIYTRASESNRSPGLLIPCAGIE